jgi:hypothetical protein
VNEVGKWKWEREHVYNSEVYQGYIYLYLSDESKNEEGHDYVGNDPEENIKSVRPQRTRQAPSRLNDYEVIPNYAVNDEGGLIHFTLIADSEPINYK